KARDLKRDRVVALKKILTGRRVAAEHRARFEREVRALARLRHDHVAGVFDSAVDPADGCLYFTMEFFEGSTLEKQLQRRSPSFAEAARLTEQLARAVQHAHRRGVVHGDLKPTNVLITAGGSPRITDFGLTRWFGPEL